MKSKTIIFLIAALILCAVYVLVRHTDLFKAPPAPTTGDEEKIFPLGLSNPVKLLITSSQGWQREFAKSGQDWRIVKPIQAKADSLQVSSLVSTLTDLHYVRAISPSEPDANDKITGLAAARWTVTVIDDKGRSQVLHVGQAVPMSGGARTYVRPQGDPKAYVVAVDFAQQLNRPLREYRDKAILDVIAANVVRISVAGQENYELEKKDGNWTFARPTAALAEGSRISGLIDKFAHLEAQEFVADSPETYAPFGLDEARRRLVLRVGLTDEKLPASRPATQSAPATMPEKSFTLVLGNPVSEAVYARLTDQPGVFKIKGALLIELQPPMDDLRNKDILRVWGEVTGVELEFAAAAAPGIAKAALVQKDNQWRMTSPYEGPASGQMVKDLLSKVMSLKADSFAKEALTPAAFGLEPPSAKITLTLAGKDQTATLLVGARSGEMTFVKSAAGASVAMVRSSELEPILAAPAVYWDTSLLSLPAGAKITRIELARPDGAFVLVRGEDDIWALKSPQTAPADAGQVAKIQDGLEGLSASKIVSLGKAAPPKFAQAKDLIAATFITLAIERTTQPASAPLAAPATQSATRPATQGATSPAAAAATAPASRPVSGPTTQKVTRSYTMHVARLDSHSYAWVDGGPLTPVGEFPSSLYDDLAAELRETRLLTLRADDVKDVKIAAGGATTELRMELGQWLCPADRAVKLDPTKVADFLKGLGDLKAERFVALKPADAGLNDAMLTVELTLEKGEPVRIAVSGMGPQKSLSRYASVSGVESVAVLSVENIQKITKTLKDFAAAAPSEPPGQSPLPSFPPAE